MKRIYNSRLRVNARARMRNYNINSKNLFSKITGNDTESNINMMLEL